MKKLKNRTKNYFVGFVILFVWNSLAHAAFKADQVYKSGRFDVSALTQFYLTKANFDSKGSKQNLVNDNSYQILDFNPQVRWGFAKAWGVRTGFNVGSAESSNFFSTRKNSSVNRIDLGVDYLLLDYSGFQTIVDFEYSHALEKIPANTDKVLNSHGAAEFKPTVISRMIIDEFYPFAYAGLNYRSEGLSMLFTYGVGAEYRFSEMGLGAVVNGFATIKDDDKTNNTLYREAITMRVDAESKKFYSVNPSLINTELFVNFAAHENLLIKLFGNYDVYGSNISQGFTVGGTVQFSFDTSWGFSSPESNTAPRSYSQPPPSDEIERIKTVPLPRPARTVHRKSSTPSAKPTAQEGFQEDTNDGVNQDYFKPITPQKEEYVEPVEEGAAQNTSSDRVYTDNQSDPGIKQDLNKLGYSIKLKKTKKKKNK